MINKAAIGKSESVGEIVGFIMEQLRWDFLPSTRVELVGVSQTYTFDGERGAEVWPINDGA